MSTLYLSVWLHVVCWQKWVSDLARYSRNIPLYISPSIIPSSLTRSPGCADENHPQSTMHSPLYFTVGMVLIDIWQALGLHNTEHFETCPNTVTHSWVHPTKKCSPAFKWLFLSNGFFLSTPPIRSTIITPLSAAVLLQSACWPAHAVIS